VGVHAAAAARGTVPDELHQAFNFEFRQADWADPAAVRAGIDSCIHAADSVGAPTTWVLSNHDVHRHPTRLGSLARANAAALLMPALPATGRSRCPPATSGSSAPTSPAQRCRSMPRRGSLQELPDLPDHFRSSRTLQELSAGQFLQGP
jgi:alpha-glucosidase